MKKIILISVSVLILVLSCLVIYTMFFSTKDAELGIEYEITYEENKSDPMIDYLIYSITVSNNSNKNLISFNADITLDEKMNSFTPLLKFITSPINLPAMNSNQQNNKIVYTKKSSIPKFSLLSKDDLFEFQEVYTIINLKLKWVGGKKTLVLDRKNLKNLQVDEILVQSQ